MTMDHNPILVEALRGTAVESMHRGAVGVVDADGAVFAAIGDIARPVFPRSAVKVLQALPLVASGAADALALSEAELALACASHNGEPVHVRTAAGMLAKAGLDAAALECGTHWPGLDVAGRELASRGESPTALHNNCSGKHAGFLCLACHRHRTAAGHAHAVGCGSGWRLDRGRRALGRVSRSTAATTGQKTIPYRVTVP